MSAPIDRAHALLYDLKRPELAEQELRKALAANPGDALAQTMLAQSLRRQGRLDEAEAAIGEAMRLAPDYSFAHRIRGWLFQERNQHSQAETAYQEALRLDPDDTYACQGLSYVLICQGRLREALDAADRGLARHPDDVWCLNRRAQALFKLDRLDEAQVAIDAALRIDAGVSLTHCNQGEIWARRQQYRRALGAYRNAVQLDPTDAWSRGAIRRMLLSWTRLPFAGLISISICMLLVGVWSLRSIGPDAPRMRFLLGMAIVGGVPSIIGLTRPPLQIAVLSLTQWRSYAAPVDEIRHARRVAWTCTAIGFALVVVSSFAANMLDAMTGATIVVGCGLPLLALNFDLSNDDRWKRVVLAWVVLILGVALTRDWLQHGRWYWPFGCPAAITSALLSLCSDSLWND
jgi:tetratricopeptide (TPR) repeat protein